MLHGRNRPGFKNINKSYGVLESFNPWLQDACNKIYDCK